MNGWPRYHAASPNFTLRQDQHIPGVRLCVRRCPRLRHEAETQIRLTPAILLDSASPYGLIFVAFFDCKSGTISQKTPRLKEWRTGIDNVDDERPWHVPCTFNLTPRQGLLALGPFPPFLKVLALQLRVRTPTSWHDRNRARRIKGRAVGSVNIYREVSPGPSRCCPRLGALRHRARTCRGA